jgi:acyl-ACP thioesterase
VNNAAYWHAVEECFGGAGLDLGQALRARLDHRHPLDACDDVELVQDLGDGSLEVGFYVGRAAHAIARVESP